MVRAEDVTVIIPAFNVAEYLHDALRSVMDNGGARSRLIVVDDGSTDGTLGVALEFRVKHADMVVVTLPNAGQGAARNLGMRLARTSHLMFVDADDLIAPNGLTALFEAADPDDDITFSNRRRFSDDASVRLRDRAHYSRQSRVPVTDLPSVHIMAVHGKLFRRDFLTGKGIVFPEGMDWEDLPFSTETLLHADRVSSIKDVTYLWRVRAGDNRSTMQKLLTPRNLAGRMRQIEMTLAIEASPEWRARFGKSWRKREFGTRMAMHLRAMLTADEITTRRAFGILRPFVLAHWNVIERTVPAKRRHLYDALKAGDLTLFLANRRDPLASLAPSSASEPVVQPAQPIRTMTPSRAATRGILPNLYVRVALAVGAAASAGAAALTDLLDFSEWLELAFS
ncbi:glycosyltransferase family 2 protein [Sphingomonas sp. ID0503]|uniref:glycosyltransferase family 2 protein n=1 Tax=Sphingomonas sp. ID0503 TaxID=3399691 RepID=UPI003AFB1A40